MIEGECSWKIVEEPQCSAKTSIQIDQTKTSHAEKAPAKASAKAPATEIAPRRQEEPKVLALQTVSKNEPQCPIDFPMEDDWYCNNAEECFQMSKDFLS